MLSILVKSLEVLYARLRIGRTWLTPYHLSRVQDPPICAHRDDTLTVLHMLASWPHFDRQPCSDALYRCHVPFRPALLLGGDAF